MTITKEELNDFCPESTTLSDAVVNYYITMANQSQACLAGYNLDDDIIKFLQLSAACHLLTRRMGGQVKSQTDFEGASQTWSTYDLGGYGLESTTFGQDALSSGYAGCFDYLNAKPNRWMKSAGRC